jgi:hypothetical protein
MTEAKTTDERLKRWRLLLGGGDADGIGISLKGAEAGMDGALAALYGGDGGDDSEADSYELRKGLERSHGYGSTRNAPKVARWLGDIRQYFPSSVVKVMQQDALERLNLRQMLLQPEMLEAVEPDVHMVATLLSLNSIMPSTAKDTARMVVRRVVEELERKLANPLQQAVMGSLNRAMRNRRPRHNEIDWNRTIRANLKHYQPEYQTVVPQTRIGYGRKRSALRHIILCIDQSGSMATSVVYAGIFGAVLASLPAIKTSVVVYDDKVVDLTAELHDPVDLLFGTQLGGANRTDLALTYCQGLVQQPQETILVLITDLYEGSTSAPMLKLSASLVASGVQMVVLLALNDEGAPIYDHQNATEMVRLGIPTFGCTPDLFPDLMAATISRQDLSQWAASNNIVTARSN